MKSLIKVMIVIFSALGIIMGIFLVSALTGRGLGIRYFTGFGDRFAGSRLIETQTVEMKDITALNIITSSSDVILISGGQDEIVIKEYAAGWSIKESFVKVRKDGTQLNVESMKIKARHVFGFGNNHRHFEVHLPASYEGSLRLESTSGDIQAVSDLVFTQCSVQTASGDISFRDLTADHILLKASSGDISAGRLEGRKELSTQSGEIDISDNVGESVITASSGDVSLDQTEGNLNICTESGGIDLGIVNLNGDVELRCGSGDINCDLPENIGFHFKAGTNSGDINTSFDQDLKFDKRAKNAEGTVGAAATFRVTVDTRSGDIDFNVR